jgi:hypothetical protein
MKTFSKRGGEMSGKKAVADAVLQPLKPSAEGLLDLLGRTEMRQYSIRAFLWSEAPLEDPEKMLHSIAGTHQRGDTVMPGEKARNKSPAQPQLNDFFSRLNP